VVEGVETIVAKDAMIRNIYTIRPENRVALARLRMLRHGIGGLPVIDRERKLVGIITLRDIDLAGHEAAALLVEDLMTTSLITENEDAPIHEIAATMLRTGIQRIPIVDADHRLIGLVTQTTIIRAATTWWNQMHDIGETETGTR
jgi:CBS domain-containing protein